MHLTPNTQLKGGKYTIISTLGQEAIRLVRSMPRWEPGSQNGVAVPVWFTLPITFKLQ